MWMGSSPLTRGKGYDKAYQSALDGIIPAYAGKRVPTIAQLTDAGDHPRLRGEKVI